MEEEEAKRRISQQPDQVAWKKKAFELIGITKDDKMKQHDCQQPPDTEYNVCV